jgi:glucan phosphorylase
LPRLLEVIYEINARFLAEVSQRWPGDSDRLRRMSLIEEGDTPMVRMAYLAIVGSFSVNGVAELHSRLLTGGLFHDFYQLWPHKFNNKTNGVTQRRWLTLCNPGLSALISERIGDGWITQLDELRKLAPYAGDAGFRQRWREVKLAANEAVTGLGGTVTHHHAVGRDHRPRGYDEQVPALFREAFAGARRVLDPDGMMNPGVLLDTPARGAIAGGVLRQPL